MQMAFDCLYTFTLWLVKVSVLVLYARLFPTQGCRLICWAVFVVCTGWALTFICIAWECLPIGEQQYKQAVPGACFNKRFDQRAVFIGYAVPNIATDLFILSMPVYRVWRMHVSLISRVGLILLLLQSVLYAPFSPSSNPCPLLTWPALSFVPHIASSPFSKWTDPNTGLPWIHHPLGAQPSALVLSSPSVCLPFHHSSTRCSAASDLKRSLES